VLIYHRILPAPDPLLPYEPDVRTFERTMRWVGETFNVMPLERAVQGLKEGRLPPRALAITFDDGYANNATLAAPMLGRLGLHATFFIATGYLDGGRMFNDAVVEAVRRCRAEVLDLQFLGLGCFAVATDGERRSAIGSILEAIKHRDENTRAELAERIADVAGVRLPTDLMMSSEQAAGLARSGFGLGAHTVSHPILAGKDYETAHREIVSGRKRLEDISGSRIGLFAYPNGRPDKDYVRATATLVRELGFDGAVSTSIGVAKVGSDPFQIPRFTPWDSRPLRFAAQLISNLTLSRPVYASE
jgi:peptidoglycan/xylan/chitin deacetylase (PgdA/CDA1 family)